MSYHRVSTRGIRARGEVGQGTQVDSSASQVQTLEPAAKNVERTPTTKESHQEPANEVVLQAMLRVLE